MRSKRQELKSTGPAPTQATASGAADAFRHSLHGMAVEDPVTNLIQDCNPAFARLVGLKVEEVIGKPILDFYTARIHPHVRQQIARADRDGPVVYEAEMRHVDGTLFPVEVGLVSVNGAGDTVTSRIASVQHIGERKKAEQAQQESEAQYRMIAESTGDMIWLFDLKSGRFTFVSPSVEKIRGFTPKEILTQNLRDALTEPSYRKATELLQLRISEIESGDLTHRTETNLFDQLHKDGSIVPSEVVTTLLCDESGRVTRVLGVARDISERIREEAARKSSEQRFAKTFHASPTAMSLTRLADGRIEDANQAFLRLFGYDRAEVIGQRTTQLGLWAMPRDRERILAALSERPSLPECEIRIRKKSGELGWILISAEIFEEEGCKYVISMVTDITERRRAETVNAIQHELAQSLAKVSELGVGLNLCLNAAIQASGADVGGIYLLNPSTGSLDLEVHRGLSPQFILEAAHYEADSEPARLVARGRAVFSTHGEAGDFLPGIARREGLRFVGIIPLHTEGRLIGCLNVASRALEGIPPSARSALETVAAGAAQAIARLTTEAALRHESLRLASIIESTHAATWEWNIQTGATVFNETWASLIGYTLAELEPTSLQTWMKLSHPEDIRRSTDLLQRHFTGELPYYQNECRMRHKDGHWIWVLDRGRVVSRTHAGEPLSMLGTHTDISSIKNAELALRESEERLRIALDGARMGVLEWNIASGAVILSSQTELIWGFAPGTFDGQIGSLIQRIHLDDLEVTKARIKASLQSGEAIAIEFRIARPDGTVHWLAGSGRPNGGNDGTPQKFLGVTTDISARKAAERALVASEFEFRAMFEVASVGMAQADPVTGRFIRVNQKLCEITGYPAEEMLGLRVPDITFEQDRSVDWDLFQRVIRGEAASYRIEKRYVRKDGRIIWVNVNMTVVRDDEDRPLRIVAMVEDVTKHKREALIQEARNRLMTYARTHSVEELLVATLDEAESLTDSRIGFYHFLDSNQATLSLQAWSTRTTREMCQAEGKGRHYDVGEAGVWADCIRERRAIIHNDYAGLPHRKGLPPGHSPIIRQLVVPVFRNNLIVSILGIGNKPLPYLDDDVSTVARLADLAWDVVELRRTEMALIESEHRLRLFVKHAPVALAMFDREMRYVEYSQRWAEDYALTQLDLRGTSHYVIFPEITETWRAIHRRALAGEVVRAEEDRFVRADGSVQWLRWEVRPWQGNDNGGIVIFSEDITARKKAEDAVRDHEARYRSLVESTSDWIWEVDTACRYTYASPRIEALLGYKPEEVIGQTAFDFMPPWAVTRIRDFFNRLAASHEPIIGLENINRHKDGHLVIMETSGMPVFSADGTWLGYRGMDRDITDRRAAEQTLRLHGAALEAAANAIVITDFNGIIEWANLAFTRASGWTREEAIGQNPRALINSGQHGADYFHRMWTTIKSGKVWQGEIVNRRKDGTLHTEDMTITPLLNAQGTISHFIAIKQDITERKQLEANSRQIQRLESVGTLAGGIAHDLNNILTPIIIGCNMVLDTTTEAGDREILTMMRDGAMRGAGIIGQLLTFSRGAEGQRVPVQPRHVLKEIGHIMRETFPREIEVVIGHADNLPSIEADPTQLHQLILNLCVNARDAMPEGGRLTLRGDKMVLPAGDPMLPPGAPAGSYIRIEVSDTGKGIPPEIRHRIFDPFFTTKPVGKGTGLGLSSVMGIVRSHGGMVTVDSELGSGTTFKVYLPAEAEERITRTPEAVPVAARGDGKLILVVDDERSIREANRLVLQRHGYRVVLASDGREALAQYQQHRGELALVLTDVMMPVMNGPTLIRELRKAEAKIPVIATTGMSESSRKDELVELGIDSFLMKPYTTDDLLQVIGRKLAPP